jgi:hypothetical protein
MGRRGEVSSSRVKSFDKPRMTSDEAICRNLTRVFQLLVLQLVAKLIASLHAKPVHGCSHWELKAASPYNPLFLLSQPIKLVNHFMNFLVN